VALTLLLINSLVLTACLQQYQQTLQQRRNQADIHAVLKMATTQLAAQDQLTTEWQYRSQPYRCRKGTDWIRIQQVKTGETIEIHWTGD